jgi:hypothetical protein
MSADLRGVFVLSACDKFCDAQFGFRDCDMDEVVPYSALAQATDKPLTKARPTGPRVNNPVVKLLDSGGNSLIWKCVTQLQWY